MVLLSEVVPALEAGGEVTVEVTRSTDVDLPELCEAVHDPLVSLSVTDARGLADAGTGDDVRINRFQTSWWDELAALGVVAHQSERWARSISQMQHLAAPEPVEVPDGLEAKLRAYQQEGLDWLAFLHDNGLGGILADDMGLGKTIQTLALCLRIRERNPDAKFLVVAPTSVVENWHREAARFAPALDVRTIHATANRRGTELADEIAGADLVVTS